MYQLDENELNVNFSAEPFDSDFWSVVRLASGMDLSVRLRTALENKDWDEIEIIFENLNHQMSFYSATYIVLPYMVMLLEQVMDEGDFMHAHSLIFNLGICLATDIPGNHTEKPDRAVLNNYNLAVTKLAGLTKRYINLYLHEIQQMDEEQRNMLLTAVLAILGEREAAYVLIMSAWDMEEFGMACDEDCEYYFEGGFDSLEEECEDGGIIPAEYEAGQWDGKTFEDPFLWASAIADLFGLKQEIETLSYLYGDFTCPECGKTKKVIDFIKQYYLE